MLSLFINFSNHPLSLWDEAQLEAARRYGELVDVPFPDVSPEASEEDICRLADECVDCLLSHRDGGLTVHVMGEMTLAFAVVERLKARGVRCVASTTERHAEVSADGVKTSEFRFVRFRRY